MRDGLGPAVLVLLGGVCVSALFLLLGVYFPRRSDQTRRAAQGSPGRAFLVGLVNALFVVGLVLVLQESGAEGLAQAIVILIGAASTIAVVFGLAAMAQLTGDSLFPRSKAFVRCLVGSGILILACLTPYVGWFGLLPYVALRGLGAFVLGWWTVRSELPAGE